MTAEPRVVRIIAEAVGLATRIEWPVVGASGWLMHAPFAAWVTSAMGSGTFVELGTHFGFSYFSVCRTVEVLGLDVQAFAVDHWRGDEHAGAYGDEVYQAVLRANAPFSNFSHLLRMDFDEAVGHFSGEVDLLHIDGFHSYEAVKHDFETWQTTLSNRGVVLFHDVREYQEGFGVHRFWDEVRAQFPSFTFDFGHGLGVLAVGTRAPESVRDLCAVDQTNEGDEVRRVFELLGSSVEAHHERLDLATRLSHSQAELVGLHARLDTALRDLELTARDRAAVDADRMRLDDLRRASEHDRNRLLMALSDTDRELQRTREALDDLKSTFRYRVLFSLPPRLRRP